ncbi:MAG: hypothetical protein M1832_000012 [Thelocarpon impressellum]|nr:MAG: hypothetical protein M1832_000012 [Thelocarpon impressellum]
MSSNPPPPPASAPGRASGLSLYANLLQPSSSTASDTTSTTISRAPVVFRQPDGDNEATRHEEPSAKKTQITSAALRFQPTKRPQPSSGQKLKPKTSFPKSTLATQTAIASPAVSNARAPVKSTLADWAASGDYDDDVNGFYAGGAGEKRQRGGRKKRKKTNKEDSTVPQNWDDIYDPARPNNYEEYKQSEEKVKEVREWKDRLYAHRMARPRSSDSDSEDDARPKPAMNQFAPPPNYSFAPPPSLDVVPPPRPLADIANEADGEDAYARRMRLTQQVPPDVPMPDIQGPQKQAPEEKVATISRAPVRYNLPAAPAELPTSEAELAEALEQEGSEATATASQEKSNRPGQKGFAERLLSKYGWTKGSGLGASGSGIINPLRVQVEKQKRKSDAEGGGLRGPPGGRGKILGGRRNASREDEEEGKFGAMSEVIVLKGMVEGLDLDAEMDAGDGGLMQEIGEECGEKYGRVERVFIHRHSAGEPLVFVRFTSQLSALRAVNALEGRIFNGNAITARFFDGEKFERHEYA